MEKMEKDFNRRLEIILAESGVTRAELARALDVSAPVVSRWLNGTSVPDVYQFRAIAQLSGLPYAWFLDGGDIPTSTEEIADRLGLGEDTVERLMMLAGEAEENEALLASVDAAVRAVLDVSDAVWEDLDRFTDRVIEGFKGQKEALK